MSPLQSENYGGAWHEGFKQTLMRFLPKGAIPRLVSQKWQVEFLDCHLSGLGLKTTVVERHYVDHDYLDDYSHYYSRCFKECPRVCLRFHFFSEKHKDRDVRNLLLKGGVAKLRKFQKSYLGFVVIRPLPRTLIGRTCIWPRAGEDLDGMAACKIDVSFFGCPLSVHCMPFQEQDHAVAACATSALWSACQVTSRLFGHAVQTPSGITEVATESGTALKRNWPNVGGLTTREMAYAIRKAGLDVIYLDIKKAAPKRRREIVLGHLYAYLSMGIPVLLVGTLSYPGSARTELHAVCANGFHLSKIPFVPPNELVACDIDEITVSDDNVGPYSAFKVLRGGIPTIDFLTQWKVKNKQNEFCRFSLQNMLIPIYPQIRTSYEDVWEAANGFKILLSMVSSKLPLKWSISLVRGNDLKCRVRAMDDVSDDEKLCALHTGLPKYVWQVSLLANEEEGAVFGVDTTDSSQGLLVVFVLFRSRDIPKIVEVLPVRPDTHDEDENVFLKASLQALKRIYERG